tara:strand:+ start:873 stop:1115 length:243 start_codon:yes stop_codon:yes gene_type:complete
MSGPILIKGFPKLAKKGWKKLTADKGVLRLLEINKKLKETPGKAKIFQSDNQPSNIQQDVAEDFAQEVADIYAGKGMPKK